MTPEELLAASAWAEHLEDHELALVAPRVRVRQMERGEHLMFLEDRVDAWHGAFEGVLRVGLVSDGGQEAGFSAVTGCAWFGEGTILKNEPRRYDVVAVTDAKVAILPGESFRWLYENSLGFSRFLVQLLNERLGQFIATVMSDRTGDAPARLAYTIASLYNPVLFPRTPRSLDISQEDLGIFAGISRQMTNKCLQQFASEGLLEVRPTGFTVLDVAGLIEKTNPTNTD